MNETRYRTLLGQFLNDYWGAFHEVLEDQSVNPAALADPPFDALMAAHEAFVAARGAEDPALESLGRLWTHVAERRNATDDAPLSAREVDHARTQFEAIFDALLADGRSWPGAGDEVVSRAVHGTPRTPLRADAAR